jgi:DNA polymerase
MTSVDENLRLYYLNAMGIQCWQALDVPDAASEDYSQIETTDVAADITHDITAGDLQSFESRVQQCRKCRLHESRKQALVGQLNPSSSMIFVLLAPDEDDDNAGQLCTGDARVLFAKMLNAINIAIDDVSITSLLKCRVPDLHTVSTAEVQHCNGYLRQQIKDINPELLVVLGDTAARCMLQRDRSLDDLRDEYNDGDIAGLLHYEGVPVYLSYSPQELLLNPDNKRKAWADLQQIQALTSG